MAPSASLRWSLAVNVVLAVLLLAQWQQRELARLSAAEESTTPQESSPGAATGTAPDTDDEAPTAPAVNEESTMPFLTKPYGIIRSRHKRSMLTVVQPLWYTQPGLGYNDDTDKTDIRNTLLIPPDTTRICIDVGTYVSTPSSKMWWAADPRTFVIAFEPNYFSASLLTRVANPIMHREGKGYWPSCPSLNITNLADNIHDCVGQQLAHVTDHFHRFLLIPVALSYRNEFATFLVGFSGRPDGGSLLTFRPKLRKKKDPPSRIQVPIAPLWPYLRMLPAFTTARNTGPNSTKLLWDTLKIDAQGVDELVIEGGGMLLVHFACIIAELDLRAYNAGHRFEYLPFMIGVLKFVRIGRNTFINPRFKEQFVRGEVLCSAPDVHHTREEILKAL